MPLDPISQLPQKGRLFILYFTTTLIIMSIDYSKIENVALSRNDEDYLFQNLHNMLTVVGADFRLTPAERRALQGINHANKGFVQDALEAIQAYEDMLPGYINKISIETAWRYYLQLERFKLLLDRLNDVVRDKKQTTGALLLRDARTVYRVLKAGDHHAIGGLETLLRRMKDRFRVSPEDFRMDQEGTEEQFTPSPPTEHESGDGPGLAA